MIKYNKKHISYNCVKQLISIFNLYKRKEVLLYFNNKFIIEKMKKAKIKEKKLKKTQNKINQLCCQRMDGNTYTLKFRRIKKVKLSKEMFAEDPKVVDKLRRQVTSGAAFMSGQEPKLQDVEIEFQGHARLYLEENPFNRSMQIGKTKDGKFTVKLKAEVNQMLFNWVVSFSDVARVIKPISLRKWLREYAEYLMENYG